MSIRRLQWGIGGLLITPRFHALVGWVVQKHGDGLPFVIAAIRHPMSFALIRLLVGRIEPVVLENWQA